MTLSCKCSDLGNPTGEFKWITASGSEKNGQNLTLENLDVDEHDGQYECFVENSEGPGLKSHLRLTIRCEFDFSWV